MRAENFVGSGEIIFQLRDFPSGERDLASRFDFLRDNFEEPVGLCIVPTAELARAEMRDADISEVPVLVRVLRSFRSFALSRLGHRRASGTIVPRRGEGRGSRGENLVPVRYSCSKKPPRQFITTEPEFVMKNFVMFGVNGQAVPRVSFQVTARDATSAIVCPPEPSLAFVFSVPA